MGYPESWFQKTSLRILKNRVGWEDSRFILVDTLYVTTTHEHPFQHFFRPIEIKVGE